jgi:uncharacterized protein YjbI with pentapeptide repeats
MKNILAISVFCLQFFFPAQAQLTSFPIPGRPDNLTQGQVDQLLANGQMNFDGLRFDNKRMEFINFDKGSFRGTTFYNTILNDGIARRKSAEPDRFDFEDANIYLSKLKRVSFFNWKFLRTMFQGDSITDATFKYCSFIENKIYNSYLLNVKFNNGSRTSLNNMQIYTSTLEGNRFDSLRFNGGAFGAMVNFKSSVFNEMEFFNVNFMKVGSQEPVKFSAGCSFQNVKFTSSTLEGVVFGEPQTSSWLANVTFDNIIWRNGSAKASFNENCLFKGPATLLQNINFTSSVFNGISFGIQNASYKLDIKQCQFNNCVFNSAITFYNCNLANSTFPSTSILQAAGVKFINCLNAPYNSTN